MDCGVNASGKSADDVPSIFRSDSTVGPCEFQSVCRTGSAANDADSGTGSQFSLYEEPTRRSLKVHDSMGEIRVGGVDESNSHCEQLLGSLVGGDLYLAANLAVQASTTSDDGLDSTV